MNKTFVPIYLQEDDVLRFALMDKEGTGKGIEEAKATIEQIPQSEKPPWSRSVRTSP